MEVKVGQRWEWANASPGDRLTITELLPNNSFKFRCDDGYEAEAINGAVEKWKLIGEVVDSITPTHYNNTEIDALTVIDDWKLSFRLGNVLKYIQRHPYKGKPIEDLKKAAQYLALEIKKLEDEESK